MKPRLPAPAAVRGFSLIELLVVVLVIAILMGLVVVGTQYAMQKSTENKTRIQIKTLENGLEKFYTDRMEYPNPSPQLAQYATGASLVLYIALTGDGIQSGDLPPNKPSYKGKPNGQLDDTEKKWSLYLDELLPADMKLAKSQQGWVDTKNIATRPIIDGYGNEVQYVCDKGTGTTPTGKFNTAYDLWSFAQDTTLNPNGTLANREKWIKNW